MTNDLHTKAEHIHQFEALFQNATIGIVLTDQQGKIINFNHFAEKQFGYTRAEVLEQPVEMLIPPQFTKKHVAYRTAYYQHPQTRVMGAGRDLHARRKDGSEFPVEVSLSPCTHEGQSFVIAFVVDITVRKRSEAILFQQNRELEEKSIQIQQLNVVLEKKVEDRTKMLKEALVELEKSKEELRIALEREKELGELKSRFVSMASHEFRTPLTTILSSAGLAQKYAQLNDQDKHHKHIVKIQEAVKSLTLTIEDFLSLGKLEEGLVEVKLVDLPPDAFIAELGNTIQEMESIAKKGQQLLFTHQITHFIAIDKKLLHNVLINLISNAIKYSEEDGIINIHAITQNNEIWLSVADNGIGISEEDQKHLFERFFRAKNAIGVQGTGLGLHIVGRYLQLMNGTIELKSALYQGTTFIIRLPRNSD